MELAVKFFLLFLGVSMVFKVARMTEGTFSEKLAYVTQSLRGLHSAPRYGRHNILRHIAVIGHEIGAFA